MTANECVRKGAAARFFAVSSLGEMSMHATRHPLSRPAAFPMAAEIVKRARTGQRSAPVERYCLLSGRSSRTTCSIPVRNSGVRRCRPTPLIGNRALRACVSQCHAACKEPVRVQFRSRPATARRSLERRDQRACRHRSTLRRPLSAGARRRILVQRGPQG